MGNEASLEGEGEAPGSVSAAPGAGQFNKPSNGAPGGGPAPGAAPGPNSWTRHERKARAPPRDASGSGRTTGGIRARSKS
ncbi:hypothetical protein MHYP_G00265760 [Metynnis hypsauchen]